MRYYTSTTSKKNTSPKQDKKLKNQQCKIRNTTELKFATRKTADNENCKIQI